MDNNPNDAYIIIGLALNGIITILAVMNSKLKIEHRLTAVETLVSVLVKVTPGAHVRMTDLSDTDRGAIDASAD